MNPSRSTDARSSPAGQTALVAALTGLAILVSCGRPTTERRFARSYTDLLKHLELREPETGEGPAIHVWSLDGDNRAVIFQPAPGRVEIGPISPAADCALRFGMGFNNSGWEHSDGVVFRAHVRQGSRESPVFEELVEPRKIATPRWQDREARLPLEGSEPFFVVLETDPHRNRQADFAAWTAPHVVCDRAIPVQPAEKTPVVLISIDTLRWDHLGVYGYGLDTSPVLDAFAGESVVFENAFSTASFTLPSHASMFTGLYPAEHGAGHRFAEAPLEDTATTLAEILREAGYGTFAFTAGGVMTRSLGMDQGFEEWTERQRANLPSTLPSVFDALGRSASRPFFLFLHTFDVHAPYEQPEGARYFQPPPEGSTGDREAWQQVLGMRYHHHHKLERFRGIDELRAAYDSGIRFVDSQIKTLFDYLKEIGRYDEALIIVLSDHGESLFENGRYFGHSHTLADAEIRIPLMIRLPRSERIGRRTDFAELVDVPPTVLAELGIEAGTALSGRPLFAGPPDRGDEHPEVALGETSVTGARYVRSRQWKVISPTADYWEKHRLSIFGDSGERFETRWQIFDLSRDPGETRNLFGRAEPFPPEVRRLVQKLRSMDPPGREAETAPPPEGELAERLRALGYLQ